MDDVGRHVVAVSYIADIHPALNGLIWSGAQSAAVLHPTYREMNRQKTDQHKRNTDQHPTISKQHVATLIPKRSMADYKASPRVAVLAPWEGQVPQGKVPRLFRCVDAWTQARV